MRHVRDILRLSINGKLSQNQISSALTLSKGVVQKTLTSFKKSTLVWPLSNELTDSDLEIALFGPISTKVRKDLALPDFEKLEKELTHPHVTIQMLFEEYRKTNEKGLSRTRFYSRFNAFLEAKNIHLRMFRKGGDQLFVDYAGTKLKITPDINVTREYNLFLAVFGSSGKAFAYLTPSQSAIDFSDAMTKAVHFFGMAPHSIVPDNLKAAVLRAHPFDPTLHPLLQKWAEHYDTVILPARVRKPKDKALVENAVRHLGGFIFGGVRNLPLCTIEAAQTQVLRLVNEFNDRPMQHYGKSRNERFDELDRPFAKPLPELPFKIFTIQQGLNVGPDYHLRFQKNFFSVPFGFARQTVDVHISDNIIEIYHLGIRLASHALPKEGEVGKTYTHPAHLPPHHLAIRYPNKDAQLMVATGLGVSVEAFLNHIYETAPHHELARRLGRHLLSLGKKVGAKRLDNTCRFALSLGIKHPRDIEAMLSVGLDLEESPKLNAQAIQHANLRGKDAFNLNPNNPEERENNDRANS
jgi:transposase